MTLLANPGVDLGWGALTNVITTIGKSPESVIRPFFPYPQSDRIISSITEAAPNPQIGYRPTDKDASSVFETIAMKAQEWVGSPYEADLAIPTDRTFSKALSQPAKPGGKISGMFSDIFKWGKSTVENASRAGTWGMEQIKEVTTVWDEFRTIWGLEPREAISQGDPDGSVTHYQPTAGRGANVIQRAKGFATDFYSQVKGLFNLGFPQSSKQPSSPIETSLQPSTMVIMAVVGIILVLIFAGGRRNVA